MAFDLNKICYKSNTGFTLIELLIAVTIFAIMSAMAYGGLSNVIANSESSREALDRLRDVQQTMLHIDRDFSQITKRNIRDEFGETKNFIISGDNFNQLIEFTRSGRKNPAKLLRSNLVRVAYKIKEGSLVRQYWTQLDRAQNTQPIESTLLSNIGNIDIRYLDNKSTWHTEWPPLNTTSDLTVSLKAIEYNMTLNDWGEIKRFYAVEH